MGGIQHLFCKRRFLLTNGAPKLKTLLGGAKVNIVEAQAGRAEIAQGIVVALDNARKFFGGGAARAGSLGTGIDWTGEGLGLRLGVLGSLHPCWR
jgi:hypothetical protein